MSTQPLISLRRGWRRWVAFQVCTIWIFWALLLGLVDTLSPTLTAIAILAALSAALIQLWIVYRYLPNNRRPHQSFILPTLGTANHLSLFRSLLYALMAGFLLLPQAEGWAGWLPGILYALATLMDIFDGYIARKENRSTLLGEILDIEFDGVGMLIAVSLGIHYQRLPILFLVIALARPLFVLGMGVRERMDLPNFPMTASTNRRMVAGLLMGFMCVILWPIWSPIESYLAGLFFGGAVAVSFARDWLVVIGWLDPSSARYQMAIRVLSTLFFSHLPLVLRIVTPVAIFFVINALPGRVELVGFLFLAGAMVLIGVAPRIGALILIGLMAGFAADGGLGANARILLSLSVGILILGGGNLSLWNGDSEWMMRRWGQESSNNGSGG